MNDTNFLVDEYYAIQKHRIAMGNQIFQLKDSEEDSENMEEYHERMFVLEKDIAKAITKQVKRHKLWDGFFKDVKGIGPIFAAALLANIDISKAEHASSLWKYCGQSVELEREEVTIFKGVAVKEFEVVEDGKKKAVNIVYNDGKKETVSLKDWDRYVQKIELGHAERRKKGEKISWNPRLKTVCFLIGESFVKTKGKYRTIYDTSKMFYQNKFPLEIKNGKRVLYTKGHIHSMAKRRAVKMFLADLYDVWRKMEDLPVSVPFAHRGKESVPEKKPIKSKRAVSKKKLPSLKRKRVKR